MLGKFDSINLVIQYLRNGLLNFSWNVGSKIPSEHEICNTLGVSRATVRCALAQYTALGVLKSIHGKGTYVCANLSSQLGSGHVSNQLRQAISAQLEFRRMLEPDLCYYTAPLISKENLGKLEQILCMMKHYAENPEEFVQYDCRFHLAIAQASGNYIALRTLDNLFENNYVMLLDMTYALGSCNAYYYHSEILSALKCRDGNRSRQLMCNHIEKSLSELLLSEKVKEIPPSE